MITTHRRGVKRFANTFSNTLAEMSLVLLTTWLMIHSEDVDVLNYRVSRFNKAQTTHFWVSFSRSRLIHVCVDFGWSFRTESDFTSFLSTFIANQPPKTFSKYFKLKKRISCNFFLKHN